jgi:O-antigen ligase
MTALACFLMAATLMVTTSLRPFARKVWVVHVLVAVIVALSASALFLGAGAGLVKAIGKDPTLTGRTAVWDLVISLNHNFLFGTGFESFWLGPRLDKVWSVYWWHPNEAHNGYIEVFLNLGWMGLALLILLIITGYRNAIAAYRRDPDVGRIRLAYFVVAVVYNFTESAVRILHPVWLCFLLATIFVPGGWTPARNKSKTKKAPVRSTPESLSSYPEEFSSPPIVATGI